MKELTIEAKAKAYDEALEKAKKLYEKGTITESIDYIFPELKESEDDRIRKAIIEGLREMKSSFHTISSIKIDNAIAWLEKQESVEEIVARCKDSWYNEGKIAGMAEGLTDDVKYQQGWHDAIEKQSEQNPIINVPSREVILSIWDLGNKWNKLTNGSISTEFGDALDYIQKHWHESEYYLRENKADNINKIEPKFKVGDWIVNNNNGGVYQVTEIRDDEYCLWPLDAEIRGYLRIIDVDNEYHLWTIKNAKEGDILASNNGMIMLVKESRCSSWGYRLSYHCAVLHDGTFEPKDFHVNPEKFFPATKKQRDILFQKMKKNGYDFDFKKKELKKIEEEVNGEDYGIDGLYHAQTILEKTLGKVEGYQSDDGILSHKCAITAVKKIKQNPIWHADDEKNLNTILSFIEDEYLRRWLKDTIHKEYDKSTEWNEDDERMMLSIEQVMNCASLLNIVPQKIDKVRTWLKSIKERIE